MLPGYNHNVRYKDKLFHVQTEDNGLDDPDLVTQVFLGGQIVAIERSSYGEVLVDGLEEKARDERIKSLMQEQHKRLLKNLIRGEYDAKIDNFGRAAAAAAVAQASAPAATAPAEAALAPAAAPPAAAPLTAPPVPVLAAPVGSSASAASVASPASPAAAAEHPELSISIDVAIDDPIEEDPTLQPSHVPNFAALDAAILAAEQNPITPESLLAPEAVLELSTSELFAQHPQPASLADTDPIPRPPPSLSKTPTPPQAFLVEHLKAALKKPEGRSDSDRFDNNDDAMLGMIEQHMHQQLPWTPALGSRSGEAVPPAATSPSWPALGSRSGEAVPPAATSPSWPAPADDASTAATLEEPQAPPAVSHIQRAREQAKNADTKRIPIEPATIGIDEMPTKLGRKKPSTPPKSEKKEPPTDTLGKQPDTLVDYGLPAALRREIDAELARRSAAEPAPPPEPPPPPPVRARSVSTPRAPRAESAPSPGLTAPPVPSSAPQAQAQMQSQPQGPQPPARSSSSASVSISKSASGSQKDVRVSGIYRGAPQKPEGRYSSVRKGPPEKLPDTLVDIDRGKVEAEAVRSRSTPSAGPRRSRPPAPDPKTSTPPAPAPRKIVEKQAPAAQQAEKAPAQEDAKRPSILVVERSLDEVILSYLYDEMAEK